MLDPFSLATGVAGLISLADLVATKGYRYVKAVKDCDEEVKQLMVELDLFGGVLRRLEKIVKEEEDLEAIDVEATFESDYVYECQTTLREIKTILTGFEKKDSSSTAHCGHHKSAGGLPVTTATDDSKANTKARNNFLRLAPNDLKWPLSKNKTIELINRLERHKATCVIALSMDAVSTIHQVLGEQKITNKQLAELQSDQRKVLELRVAESHGESAKLILDWFSPIDPSKNHQLARSLYQRGTGKWFIDGPEFTKWHEKPNSALWIYGIPGAGKTILSSLIIEEVFNLKASGTAYYYCTYRDPTSQKPTYILGSLVRQLAERNTEAFLECKAFHAARNPAGRPSSQPTEAELGELLQSISKHFAEVSLIVDGLDECGAAAGIDRTELTRVLSNIHDPSVGTIRIAIASRREQNIDIYLAKFDHISIAAMSSDLELYVAAEVARRGRHIIRDENIREEIIEALTSGAEGTFQWVKCQLDFLFKLPNDKERRKALKTLPPDLPATYIRILERLDRDFSPETQTIIHRVLMWLAFEEDQQKDLGWSVPLALQSLPVAVSIDVVDAKLDHEIIPRPSDISDWCSSLVRLDSATNKLTFSHFSVREFLTTDEEKVPSVVARKYLLNESRDKEYLAAVCLTYLSLPGLPNTINFDDEIAIQDFDMKYPFYAHAASELTSYLRYAEQSTTEHPSLRKFFTPRANCCFTLWFQYVVFYACKPIDKGRFALNWDPLHLAVGLELVQTVRRLLSEGANVNALGKCGIPPIAFAYPRPGTNLNFNTREFTTNCAYYSFEAKLICNLPILELLISHGADLTCEFEMFDLNRGIEVIADPFCHAFMLQEVEACRILLKHGAKIEEDMFGNAFSFLEDFGRCDKMVAILKMVLSGPWIPGTKLRTRLVDFMSDSSNGVVGDTEGCAETTDELIIAIKFANGAAFDHLLSSGTDVEVRNSEGKTALYIAIAMEKKEFTSKLLQRGANIHVATPDGETPLLLAYKVWGHSGVEEIFGSRECFEFTNFEKFYVLQLACANWDIDFLKQIFSRSDDFRNEDGPLPIYAIRPVKSAAVLRLLHTNGLLYAAERYRAMFEAYKCGDEEVLREAFTQCTTAEVVGFRSLVSNSLEKGLLTLVDINRMLLRACEEVNVELVTFLLSSGANANFLDNDGSRPVHRAAHNSQILQILGEKGADINLRDLNGETALHWAALKGSVDGVEWLLANGAVVNPTSGVGLTPLRIAAKSGHEQVCRILLESGADCEQHTTQTRSTPLHSAAEIGNLAVVEILLDFNADPWARNKWKETPLHVASRIGHAEIVERLLRTPVGAATLESVEENGGQPLHEAAANNNATICQILLRAGARLNHLDNDGCSPLVLAIQRGHRSTMDVLLEAHASIAIIDPAAYPPLHASVKHIDLLSRLLDLGVDINAVDNDGNTALHLAAEINACAAIHLILERKPDLAVVNKNYMTALDVIEKNRQPGSVVGAALLRGAGAENSATHSHVDCPESSKPKLQEDDQESGGRTARPRESGENSLLSNDAASMLQSLCANHRASSLRIQALLQELEFLCGAQSSQSIQEMPIRSAVTATLVDSAITEPETIADGMDHSVIDRDCKMTDS